MKIMVSYDTSRTSKAALSLLKSMQKLFGRGLLLLHQ